MFESGGGGVLGAQSLGSKTSGVHGPCFSSRFSGTSGLQNFGQE